VNNIGELKDKNILLLQGPVGLFFKKVGNQFTQKGANVYRIGLNAGDEFFASRQNYTAYRGKPEAWYDFILDFLKEHKIDKIFIFGDCRYYQSLAVGASDTLGVEVFVFEEGYLRPHYITLERHGVNDYSRISRHPEFYKKIELSEIPPAKYSTPNPICNWSIVIAYYFIAKLLSFRYPHYRHHRNFSATQEFFFGTRSLIRKVLYTRRDNKYLPKIKNELSDQYFFVPLQTHNDFQILQHSGYGSIEKFIIEVLESFALHANKRIYLMFKHHPIDRGRKNYKDFIVEQAHELGIKKRVIVVHDLHLPTCLEHAKGTITINSTVGLSSVLKGTPTITLGRAIYNIEGLTNKNISLDDFWANPQKPDKELAQKFKHYLIHSTQLNGNFFGRMPDELR
jgi:capsular polysaccharide export protein